MHRSRFWLLICILLALVIGPFLIWGEWFENFFDLHGAKTWLEGLGSVVWLGGMLLLVADLVLPVPGTVVMSALGLVYGWFLGGLISACGSCLSGLIAYALCWRWGRGFARWLAGEEGLQKGEKLFQNEKAGWLVALSRWMPVLPEAISCLAGMSRMPLRRFFFALLAGTLPMAFAFAAIGDLGVGNPSLALGLSALLPLALYAMAVMWMKRRQ